MSKIDRSLYVASVREYLTMPKDIGFEYMESIVDEIMENENLSWTQAYELFGSMCDSA